MTEYALTELRRTLWRIVSQYVDAVNENDPIARAVCFGKLSGFHSGLWAIAPEEITELAYTTLMDTHV